MDVLNLTAEAVPHWEDDTGTTHTVVVSLNGEQIAVIDAGFMMEPDDREAVTHVVARWARDLIAKAAGS